MFPWTRADDGWVRGLVPGMRVAREQRYGPAAEQCFDLYRPPEPEGGRRPAVLVVVHGGGWRHGDKAGPRVIRHKVAHWVARGVAVASVNYRLLPEAAPLEQADDLARAIAALQAGSENWGIDGARMALMGHSAGAHLCALLSVDHGFALRRDVGRWLATVCLDSAAYDVEAVMREPHLPLYDDAFGSDASAWRSASPLARIEGPPVAPLLLVHSSRRPGSARQASRFAAAVRAAGGEAEALAVDLSHLEINELAGTPGGLTNAIDAFLQRHGVA